MLVAVKKMGIINIRNHLVLLVKFPHKFYNTLDLPWVQLTWQKMYSNGKPPHERKCVDSFWWKDIISFAPNFLLMTRCRVNNGLSVSSWNDHWDLGVVNALYTQLVSFARKKVARLANFWLGRIVDISSWPYLRLFISLLSSRRPSRLSTFNLKRMMLGPTLPMAFFLVTKFTVSCKDHFLLPYYSKGMWGSKVQPKHKFFF
jgi:hypothetical protein